MAFTDIFTAGAVAAFFQVVMIDLALAGDNAVAVGMAAAGLPHDQRRKAIIVGLAGAVVMRVTFALITTQLLQLVGLLVAGGFLLLWVCWKMWRDLRIQGREERAEGEAALAAASGAALGNGAKRQPRAKTLRQALVQILIADLTMSLDNVLAVAGAARQHPWVLISGLLLSITLTGLAASWIAKLLSRLRWIGFVGLAIVLYVALHMIWMGTRTVVIDMGQTRAYNAAMPQPLDISPAEAAKRRGK
ncbi:YjbE family putative metal transport protein [Phenylobacterium sp.]|jgi:YjbE family integral membrane protein|uniref:YjbE family putative metal transport protein n=1 Tax=Phenylobacterium sp. TaxID=1871053 RepID=UPI002E366387|nr:YjbE family putative metal transport protein [Phenylobacterium sp.]HEX4711164.1 YjbE family putative metal transport protein [Phenylobacterium sp.]